MKRALVQNGGLFSDAYNAGVNSGLADLLGPDYFDAHICTSGSIFGSTFFVAGQAKVQERIWRERVCDGQLIRWANLRRGRRVLDLDYLIDIFQSPGYRLDLDALFAAKAKVHYTLTEYRTGKSLIVTPTRENIWTLMKAACAVPYLYRKVETQYGLMTDGGLSNACPVEAALEQGYDEVVVIYNLPEKHQAGLSETALYRAARTFMPRHLSHLMAEADERRYKMQELFYHPKVKVIRPAHALPIRSWLDGDKFRLNLTIDLGRIDAKDFVAHRS